MTIPDLLNKWLKGNECNLKRYNFIVKRTKNKRIKKKAIYRAALAKHMVASINEIIEARKQSGIDNA